MKLSGLILLLFLVACAPVKSLEQLKQEAEVTGDWAAVEQRERILARQDGETVLECPTGYASFCQTFAGRERCGCADRQELRQILAGR